MKVFPWVVSGVCASVAAIAVSRCMWWRREARELENELEEWRGTDA